jgi:hypothetical protein
MDFTLTKYKQLLSTLQQRGFSFQTFEQFLKEPASKSIVLRHDVDLLPYNSLAFAKIQAERGIIGSYFFRAVPESWDEQVIKEIANLGHEIGYHYENLTTCNGDIDKAYKDFTNNLEKLRKLASVSTICMHGSPRSKWDSKDMWKKYNYRDLGIIGEPYFDVDFDNVFYLTDTGRRWDGWKVSLRDKVPQQERWVKEGLVFHSTQDIIDFMNKSDVMSGIEMADRIMFTFHPNRWNNKLLPWVKEFIMQNIKNQVKWMLVNKMFIY